MKNRKSVTIMFNFLQKETLMFYFLIRKAVCEYLIKKYNIQTPDVQVKNPKIFKMHLNLHVIIKVHAILRKKNEVLVQKHKTFSNKRAQYKSNPSQITHWCFIKPRALFYIIECCQDQTFFKVHLRMILNNL